MRYALLLILALFVSGSAWAQEVPRLSYPAECRIGGDCWILSLVDMDPSDAYTDYRCGARTYAGHKGTDIALLDPASIAEGVDVYAAADGKVLGTRDGEPDHPMGRDPNYTKGKECGNGVRIDHGNGWATQYCHLRKGSISVTSGQTVIAGQKLGEIGNSGFSETPHLHFQLEHNGKIIDPFSSRTSDAPESCDRGTPLWDENALEQFGGYEATFIRHAGFAPGPTNVRQVQATPAPEALSSKDNALVLYAIVYGVRPGSILKMDIYGPDGSPFAGDSFPLPEAKARQFQFFGRRTPSEGWPPGRYTGLIQVEHNGQRIEREVSVILE